MNMNNHKTQLFVKAPMEMVRNGKGKITGMDMRVYLVIRSHKDERRDGPVFPSRRRVANYIGCDIATISRSVKRLEQAGFITHTRGSKGLSNQYFFIDLPYIDSDIDASMPYASTHLPRSGNASILRAHSQHQLDQYNKSNKLEAKSRLYHGQDICSVKEDGNIEIRNHSGQWVNYSGGDDQRFRFKKLQGVEAKRAAIEHFKEKPRKTSEKDLGLSEDKQD